MQRFLLGKDVTTSIVVHQAARVLDDYQYGRDYIDPSHVKDGGVTKDHTRQWKVLQELQVELDYSAATSSMLSHLHFASRDALSGNVMT